MFTYYWEAKGWMSKSDYVFVAPSGRPPELRRSVEMICPAAPIQKTRPGAEYLHMKNYTYQTESGTDYASEFGYCVSKK